MRILIMEDTGRVTRLCLSLSLSATCPLATSHTHTHKSQVRFSRHTCLPISAQADLSLQWSVLLSSVHGEFVHILKSNSRISFPGPP